MKTQRPIRVQFGLCDVKNPGCGYQLKIEADDNGDELLFTSVNPETGKDLLTAQDCLDVVQEFITARCQHVGGIQGPQCCLPIGHAGSHAYKCAGPSCPGLSWIPSNTPHPTSCARPRP